MKQLWALQTSDFVGVFSLSLTSNKILYDLFQFRRTAVEATEIFASWKHDADLCPKLQRQIEVAYSAIEKYQTITYDIQGPRDAGTDVILREPTDGDYEYVCFQVKSHDDLKNPDYLRILKAQYFDSQSRYGQQLRDYYILLCSSLVSFDQTKARSITSRAVKGKIRVISGEFARTPHVHVIEPEYALAFLRLAYAQIDAVVKKRLGETDVVQREATELVINFTPTETALLLFIIWSQIENNSSSVTLEEITNSDFLREIYDEMPDLHRDGYFFFEEDIENREDRETYNSLRNPRGFDFDTRILYDLMTLEGELIEVVEAERYTVEMKRVKPIAVTLMDGEIRFEYDRKSLLHYAFNVLLDPALFV